MTRRKKKTLVEDEHHVLPSSRGGTGQEENMKTVPTKYHRAYHLLFANLTPREIVLYLMEMWFMAGKPYVRPEEWLKQRKAKRAQRRAKFSKRAKK